MWPRIGRRRQGREGEGRSLTVQLDESSAPVAIGDISEKKRSKNKSKERKRNSI